MFNVLFECCIELDTIKFLKMKSKCIPLLAKYIYNKNKDIKNNPRVILKIHYCIYPRWAYYFGKILSRLSIQYNRGFRKLFLFT